MEQMTGVEMSYKKLRKSKYFLIQLCAFVLVLLGLGTSGAAEFELILKNRCFECHSHESKKIKGGLVLDSIGGIELGGDSGPLIEIKDVKSSLLLKAIDPSNKDLEMPPDNPLTKQERKILEEWVLAGAPISPSSTIIKKQLKLENDFDLASRKKDHWAWQPIQEAFEFSDIDAFIREKQVGSGLEMNPEASPETLLRRASIQLTGLPPSREDYMRFEKAYQVDSEKAFEREVDKLLSDPGFGEQWARHWMDIVKYSETKGHVTDQERPFSWKYRDYLIHAFNSDLPYNQFTLEQIAGDLLPPKKHRAGWNGQTNVGPIATSMLFMYSMHFMSVDPVKQRWDEIDSQIEVVGKAFLGLTLDCARCHDHKFDAVSQKDYYALAGFFLSTEQSRSRTAPRVMSSSADAVKVTKLEKDFENYLEQKRKGRFAALKPKVGDVYFPVSEELGIQTPGDTKALMSKISTLSDMDFNWSYWTRSAGEGQSQDAHLMIRGNHKSQGGLVSRNFLEALRDSNSPQFQNQSGRLWLAHQLTKESNPLTARVWANRVWAHVFGEGIVRTPNNFGAIGAMPTHPELLDFLSRQLIESGWSTKFLIKKILLSKTWRQSSKQDKKRLELDPENKLWSHQNRRRMTAEQIRDSILYVSGQLDRTLYGPSIDCYVPPYATANKASTVPASGPLDGNGRRSIYIKARRNFHDPFLKVFDLPDNGQSIGKRAVTSTPQQALAFLNSPFIHHVMEKWGIALANHPSPLKEHIKNIWLQCFGEDIQPKQLDILIQLTGQLSQNNNNLSDGQLWKNLVHVIINQDKFIYCE